MTERLGVKISEEKPHISLLISVSVSLNQTLTQSRVTFPAKLPHTILSAAVTYIHTYLDPEVHHIDSPAARPSTPDARSCLLYTSDAADE